MTRINGNHPRDRWQQACALLLLVADAEEADAKGTSVESSTAFARAEAALARAAGDRQATP